MKKNERRFLYDQTLEAVDGMNYVGVTLESVGRLKNHTTKVMAKGDQSLVATVKCSARTAYVKETILRNVYEVVCESRMLTGVLSGNMGFKGGRKENDYIPQYL